MFGIGMPELIVILVVILIVIGPKKLPDMARSLAKGLSEFKKATQDIKDDLGLDEEIKEIKQTFDEPDNAYPLGEYGEEYEEEAQKKQAAADEVEELMDYNQQSPSPQNMEGYAEYGEDLAEDQENSILADQAGDEEPQQDIQEQEATDKKEKNGAGEEKAG